MLLRPLALCTLLCACQSALAGDLIVSAASSLTDAFREVAGNYQAAHPGTRVLLNFGASGALLQQMARGAPVDVFASADQTTMDLAVERELVQAGARRDFAGNALVIVVPGDSRQEISRLEDLLVAGVHRIAVSNPASVPAGRYARQALETAGLWSQAQARVVGTQSARQSLDYVARGEVDAAFVYRTDASSMPGRVRIALEMPLATAIRYPIAPAADSGDGAEALRFVDYVLSPGGQAVLGRHGFLAP
jgi:molybdate transport system substrate-binding protein